MRKKTYLVWITVAIFALSLPTLAAEEKEAETAKPEPAPAPVMPESLEFSQIVLPANDTIEYWVIREQCLSDLTPFLTKKRKELKEKRQILADYLVQIGKAEDFAAQDIKIPNDPKLYALAFGVLDGLEQKNIDVSKIEIKKRPDWNGLVEFAMKNAIYEGYVPTAIEGAEELNMYKEIVFKKERYGQKVHKELRPIADQCIKMWLYLGTINEQENLRTHVAQMKLKAAADKQAMRDAIRDDKRQSAYAHSKAREEKKFEQGLERSRQERYDTRRDYRQDSLYYRQTRLDDRYSNRYHY